jgi:hypothetical protein
MLGASRAVTPVENKIKVNWGKWGEIDLWAKWV